MISEKLRRTVPSSKLRVSHILLMLGLIGTLIGCSFEPKPSRIYFTAKTIGPSVNIYSMDHKGALTKHTDDDRWRDLDVDIASDGTLVFSSNRKDDVKIDMNKRSDSFDIFLLPRNQTKPERLIDDEYVDTTPKFSPLENTIAYIKKREAEQQLVVQSLQHEQSPKVVLATPQIESFAWSNDGKSLLVAHSNTEQSVMALLDLDTGSQKVLFTLPRKPPNDQPGFRPNDTDEYMKLVAYLCWSPDQKKIAYVRHPVFRGVRQLRLYDLETREDKLVSEPKVQVQDHCDWRGDSSKLLYSGLVDYRFYFDEQQHRKVYEGSMQVFEYTIGGDNEQLTQGEHMFKHPVYSPDEKQIAYLYSEQLGSRVYQLYTMTKSGDQATELFNNVSPVSSLSWQTIPRDQHKTPND